MVESDYCSVCKINKITILRGCFKSMFLYIIILIMIYNFFVNQVIVNSKILEILYLISFNTTT